MTVTGASPASVRTFQSGVVELLPGYIGHDVAGRKAINARRAFADRLGERDGAVEVRLNPDEFQDIADRWCDHLPGLIGVHGPAGYGKTFSASYVAAMYNAVYIELGFFDTQTFFLEKLLEELGLTKSARNNGVRAQRIIEALIEAPRPILIDQVDVAIRKGYLEGLRQIADNTKCPMMLLGEQHLPEILGQWERVSSRILAYVEMRPCTLDDALTLRHFYEDGVTVDDDLVAHFLDTEKGVTRRIVVQLEHARQRALEAGADRIGLQQWKESVGEGGGPWAGKSIR